MAQIIKVRFAQGDSHMRVDTSEQVISARDYDYFWVGDSVEVKKDQFAVVNVSGVLKIVKVVGVAAQSMKAHSHVIALFDLESFQARVEKDQKRKDLIESIEVRAAEVVKLRKLNDLASEDEILKAMLEELKGLGS